MAGEIGFFKRIGLAVGKLFDRRGQARKQGEVLPFEPEPAQVSPASGMEAIDAEFARLYPDAASFRFAAKTLWRDGGKEPLDAIKVFDSGDSWHFVSYGLTELYEKQTRDTGRSGYGAEFTLRLKKRGGDSDRQNMAFLNVLLQALALRVFEQREQFRPWSYIHLGRPLDQEGKSALSGFITLPDTLAQSLVTHNGSVDFLELVGVTGAELDALSVGKLSVQELYDRLGSDLTDLDREPDLNFTS